MISFSHRLSLLLLTAWLHGCSLSNNSSSLVRDADELSKQGQHDAAIASYREHMDARLAASDRPEAENPYFYLLMMGDVELSRGDTAKALALYEEAEQNGVEKQLVADRYRAAASWYESHGQLKEAMELLAKYRDRDDLLFDAMADRIAKELTAREGGFVTELPN